VTQSYDFQIDVRSGIGLPARHYIGIAEFDEDGLPLRPEFIKRSTGAVDTTLAVALNPGDTTMVLTSAAGWYSGTDSDYRQFTWWPYTSAMGTTFAPYTYSRNTSVGFPIYPSSSGTWSASAVVGNTITLRAPWPGPGLPAGTPVRNSWVGNFYNYCALANGPLPVMWTTLTCSLTGLRPDTSSMEGNGWNSSVVRSAQPLVLANYGGTGPGNLVEWRDAAFVELP
jgi:hypothetical protein